MGCGDFRWGNFKQHCSKEYRTGETCGMKLVFETIPIHEQCKICDKIRTKLGRIRKEEERIKRWRHEGSKRAASIEKALADIAILEREIEDLQRQKERYNAPGGRHGCKTPITGRN